MAPLTVCPIGAALALKSDKECDLKQVKHLSMKGIYLSDIEYQFIQFQAIDKCIKSDFLIESGDKKFKNLPKNENEMNQMCDNVVKAEECTKDFIKKCAENDKEKRSLDNSMEGMVRVVK